MIVGLSSLIFLAHHCYDWHPGSRYGWTCNQLTSKVDGGITGLLEVGSGGQFSPSVRPHNRQPGFKFRPPSATVVSAEPFSHGTGTLLCLQKEMATYRHWSVSLWRDPDDVPHCRILFPDKTEWRLISATFCGWRRCFVADQLWFMTRVREEEEWAHQNHRATDHYASIRWLVHCPLMVGLLHLVQQGMAWAGCGPAQSPPRCTKCNSSPINGQCTNFILFDVKWQACSRESNGESAIGCSAVPAPPIIEIQRFHTSDFIKTLVGPQPPVWGPKADVQFPHLWFSTLTTEGAYGSGYGPLNVAHPQFLDNLMMKGYTVFTQRCGQAR